MTDETPGAELTLHNDITLELSTKTRGNTDVKALMNQAASVAISNGYSFTLITK